jgi:osmotically-inducible protein OsmY
MHSPDPTSESKADIQLKRDVVDELGFQPRIDPTHIGVAVNNGVVTLTGFVKSYAEKLAAENAVHRVKGVKAVAQDIVVRFPESPKTSDPEIAERIVRLFEWDSSIPDDLDVKVENGWVTLAGSVEWHYQREAAKRAVGRLNGVKGVSNLIEVEAQPSTEDIERSIMNAFRRNSDLAAKAINVETDGHIVRLSGEVHGWNDRVIAEQAAWCVPGVRRVEDNLLLV